MRLLKRYSWWEWSVLLALAFISFLWLGLPFIPMLNSDIAVHVYMTEELHLPRDLYYWHQDRLGSLVPMVGFLLSKVFFLSPMWACSLAEYLFLFAGCVAFWHFIPRVTLRLLFAALWFFPAFDLIYFVLPAHPYSEQLAMAGWAFVSFDWMLRRPEAAGRYFLQTVFFAICATWASDLSVLFFIVLFIVFFKHLRPLPSQLMRKEQRLYLFLSAGLVLISGYILWRGKQSNQEWTYSDTIFASIPEWKHSTDILWKVLLRGLFFDTPSALDSIMFYSSLILLGTVFVFHVKHRETNRWTRFFLWTSLVVGLFIYSTRWLSINWVMLKYFIPCFILLWVALFSLDITSGWLRKLHLALLSVLVLAALPDAIVQLKEHSSPNDYKLSEISAMDPYRRHGFIGDYWHTYVLGITDPADTDASPHYGVRSGRLLRRALSHDTIYFVTNQWDHAFGDTIFLFDKRFLRLGPEESVGRIHMIPYRIVSGSE